MTITTVFDPPLLSDSREVFDAKAFALVAGLNTFSTEANALQIDVNAKQATASGAATAASSSASAANTSASNAGSSATAAASSASAADAAKTQAQAYAAAAAAFDPALYVPRTGGVSLSGALGFGVAPVEAVTVHSGTSEYAVSWQKTGAKKWALGSYAGGGYLTNATDGRKHLIMLDTGETVLLSGFVGIGTAAPQARLHVGTPAATADAVVISDATNYTLQAGYVSSGVGHFGGATGSGLRLRANGVDTLQLNTNGSVLAVAGPLGYGVGVGGTVTQPTNKSTAVTLNKPSGQITMNNAALAANTTVAFTLANSLISAGDTLALEIVSGAAAFTNYRLLAGNAVTAGQRGIAVTNQSGGSLSEAIVIQFNIIKGATS